MLRTWHRLTKAEMAEATGIPLRTLSRRLNGGGHWEWQEVAAMSAYFNVPMSVFHEGPEALMSGVRSRAFWTPSRGVSHELVAA